MTDESTGGAGSAAPETIGPFVVETAGPAIRRVRYANPPVNLVVPETVTALHGIVTRFAAEPAVKVVIFESAVEGFFINHFDLTQAAKFPIMDDAVRSPLWVDMVLKLAAAPFVSIAAIRGRTRGGGDEFALACDLRYASLEKARFGQPEVGTGILPGGGGTERLPRQIGRDRALEAILSAEDYDASTAERWGWVTRALPDAELDGFVTALATRLAGFEADALRGAKAQVNRASLPPDADLRAAYREYFASLGWPGFPKRGPRLGKLLAEHGLDVELRLGHYLGQISD